ncbi:MAG: flagellar basal body rod protein FlgF, partial [Alphaproteobacteria bacterium]|nr:flagellar basal body rod protein FlgF [Alphaproteobacteria bacterium]
MDRLIYTQLAGLEAAMARQNATAQNLSNANTPGYRADQSSFASIYVNGAQETSRVAPKKSSDTPDMTSGAVQTTGRNLDIALEGDALLAVQQPGAGEGYTRRGDLQINSSGTLTTGDGFVVLGQQGPVTLPPAQSVSIDSQGNVLVVPPGGDPSQPQVVDQIKLVSPAGKALNKATNGLLVAANGVLPDDPDARVQSGALEGSNVSVTGTLVSMIDASRNWDSQLKMIGVTRDMDT